jgi:steroid delta-isomerase-like uncharacterized protein
MLSKLSKNKVLAMFIQEVWNEGKADAAERYSAPFPDQRFDLLETFSDDNAVVATWLWAGTHRGDLPGFPASGKQIKMSGATVYYFTNDRIDGHWQIVDRLGVLQQLRSKT